MPNIIPEIVFTLLFGKRDQDEIHVHEGDKIVTKSRRGGLARRIVNNGRSRDRLLLTVQSRNV